MYFLLFKYVLMLLIDLEPHFFGILNMPTKIYFILKVIFVEFGNFRGTYH